MPAKKSKGGCKKKGAGGGAKQKRGSPRNTQKCEDVAAQNPHDRVAFIRPFWETLSQEERVQLLTVPLEEIRSRAREHAAKAKSLGVKKSVCDTQTPTGKIEPRADEILEEALRRIKDQPTWKIWKWGPDGAPYTDAEVFRKDAEEEHIAEELRNLLPRDDGKPVEKPAEAALRERMTNLLGQIHVQLQNAQDAWRRGVRNPQDQVETVVRDGNIDLVIAILEALQQEHHCLYQTILTPVTDFVCGHLSIKNRKSSRSELFFEDLEKLPPEEVARLYEWLTEKVDSLCAKLKPDPKDEEVEEEESVGDIDLFSLTPTPDGQFLTVNPKWLQHLQERRLSEEGQPRKVKEGEDPHRVGLVLEWVYGSIVSTAEKARDGAKRPLGSWEPSIKQAHENLVAALKDQRDWEVRSTRAKELLKSMVDSRKEAEAIEAKLGIVLPGTRTGQSLADQTEILSGDVIVKVLKREELLTRAKLHILQYERMMGDTQLRSLRAELMQGEPELQRLKRELEEVKNTPRGLEGMFRTAAEKERHRAQLADSLLEEQLEVQSAFREQGVRLQGIYDKRQRTEIEMAKRDQEINQLRSWQGNVNRLIAKYEVILGDDDSPGDVTESCTATNENEIASQTVIKKDEDPRLLPLLQTFNRDFRKQLYSDQDDQQFFNRIKGELKQVERRLEDGMVVLQHLEMFLINVACDDPGSCIGGVLVLPYLQERLDKEAMEFATQKASLAEEEILRMEMESNEKVSAEVEKKQKQKKKLKDKVRLAKERKAAEQKAKEEAERAKAEEQQIKEKEKLEAERIKREEEIKRLKREEEQLIEKRRLELLQEENGYWRMRMEAAEVPVPETVPVSSVRDEPLVEDEDNFQSVSNTRRRTQDRRQQFNRGYHHRGSRSNGNGGQRWNGALEVSNRGDTFRHRRHKSADLESFNRRRNSNARDQPADRQGLRKTLSSTNRQLSNARPLQGQSSADLDTPQRSGPSHTLTGHIGSAPPPSAPGQPLKEEEKITTANQQEPTESTNSDAHPTAVEEVADTGVVTLRKTAWVKGSIPPEVLGHTKGDDEGKQGADSAKGKPNTDGCNKGGANGEMDKSDSVSSPETPEATEAGAPSVMSDSDNSQQNAYAGRPGSSRQNLSQAKIVSQEQSEVQELKDINADRSDRKVAATSSPTFKAFRGSGEQFFKLVQSASVPEENEKEDENVDTEGEHNSENSELDDDVDDAASDADSQNGEDGTAQEHPTPHGPVPTMQPPPYAMMGGPMGQIPGFHPGMFPHMRSIGHHVRPFVPIMGAPGFVRPTTVIPAATSGSHSCMYSPSRPAGGAPSASMPPNVSTAPPSNAAFQRGPLTPQALPPAYFLPPQMMQHGGPMMTPFMPLMPGQWFGFPMAPPQGPTFPPTERELKKFTLRPTAKEFIPPSMLAQGKNEGSSSSSSTATEDEQGESDAEIKTEDYSNTPLECTDETENVEELADGLDTEQKVDDKVEYNSSVEEPNNDVEHRPETSQQSVILAGC